MTGPTPPPSGHDAWDELAAGHALHALSPEEDRRFLVHLADCPDCTAALEEYAFVAAQLGSLSRPQEVQPEPPAYADIRDRLLAPAPAGPDGLPPLDVTRRRHYQLSRRVLALAAAIVVLAAGGGLGWRLSHGSSTSTAAGCAAAGCHVVSVTSAGHGSARVVVSGSAFRVTTAGLTRPATGRMYVLWQLPGDGRPVPVAEFTSTSATGRLVRSYSDTTAFAISSEQAGVTPTRPSKLLALGPAT
jgi:hypothetical protein